MIQRFQPISVFKKDPYKKILTFPQVTESEITKRMVELRKLGITHISFTGPLQIEKCHILGKGYVGMVVLAKKRSRVVALKIRRTDSPRKNMTNEAKLLKTANKLEIGPKFIKNSKNFLMMEYIDGEKIIDFKKNNLHLVGYSRPINKTFSKNELFKNLYFFSSKRWDFELKDNTIIKLPNENTKLALKLALEFLHNNEFKDNRIIDARIKNQIILND